MEKWTDDQIRELCERATEGPWSDYGVGDVYADNHWLVADFVSSIADRKFIAAARELVPVLLDRAQRAETELHRCYKDIEQLTAERRDLKTMLADAGIRNAVLEKRLNYTTELLAQLGNCPSVEPVQGCINVPCGVCWHEWLEQEVRA